MIIQFTLPFKLLSKPNSYRFGKGRCYSTPAITQQIKDIKHFALISLPSPIYVPSLRQWRVEINLFVDNRRRFDIDNTAKILLDCMNGMVWKDDSQCVELIIRKTLGAAKTETIVTLTEL